MAAVSRSSPERLVADGAETVGDRIPRPGSSALPRMWVEAFLLLALEQSPSHGYELIRRMTAVGLEAIDGGGVYRILRQLEADGLVGSGWVTSTQGPARREYALTDAGRAHLDVWAVSLRESQFMLDQFFSLYPPPVPPGKVSRSGRRSPPVGGSGTRERDAPSSRELSLNPGSG